MERKRAIWNLGWQSVAVPVVLMFTGVLLVLANGLGLLSFDRIQNLWPAVVILVGLSELTTPAEETVASNARSYSLEQREPKRNG
ncbi:MAG: hypothetical protein JO033_14520 [Acidobacteriaceae bacterium]|nr:hypothetical protein [Acidobacteriaceae bacterium]MBV9497910.1 hypothetical protein [Acidobacteriaceae bacterium]